MSREQQREKVVVGPGKGMESIMLGCTTQEVRSALGKPDAAKTYSDEIWWNFLDAGIDCGFSRDAKALIALNFFRNGVANHREAQVITEEGLGPGVSRLVVRQQLGEPSDSDEAWTDQQGKFHRSWVKYSSGIAFEFGHDSKADVMTIYLPK